ncbi:helix-turn-helix domain-containing protein [Leifsonia sp. LS-T14]|uniref:helix-turn-helix domain-containing protein n=1 Tax=unclassified Leifsonia TaxID=2663824 RepID=UPI0035A58F68
MSSAPPTIDEGSFGLTAWEGVTDAMAAPHAHDDLEVNVSSSPIHYIVQGRELTIPEGSFAVFWAAQPHQLLMPEPARMQWLTIPLRLLLSWRLPAPFLQRLLTRELIVGPCRSSTFDPGTLRLWQAELAGSPVERETAEQDIEVRLRRALQVQGTDEAGSPGSAAGSRAGRVATMARHISTHASGPLSVADVAAVVHLHPNYAMALFKRVLGVSIGDYLNSCRIHEAQRLLLTSDRTVAAIAHESGYASLSQFHERFRQVVGVSPGAYRRGRLPNSSSR